MVTVTLRKRNGKNGRVYLYLDFYPSLYDNKTRKQKRREYLHISIYANPKTSLEKTYNRKMMEVAEAFRCKRSLEIASNKLGFYSETNRTASFLDFYLEQCEGHDKTWFSSHKRFSAFMNGKCTFGQISVDLCDRYKEWLLSDANTYGASNTLKTSRKICYNTAVKMYIIFRRILKDAYKAHLLSEDINMHLEGLPYKRTHREYLSMNEVRTLWKTPCRYGVLKDASMFSIFTGLRISDILTLNWDEIQDAPDGKPCIRKVFQKTDIDETVFISEESLRFCGPRRPGELVFKDLRKSMTGYPLKAWLKEAGITKKISFHCFRHTNATLMLAGGANIYTVSGQLTHTNVKTTQIYGHLVDESKRKASEIITLEMIDKL